MDFVTDLRGEARQWLPTLGYQDADQLSDAEALTLYLRIHHRIPQPRPRSFHRPAEPLPTLSWKEEAGLAQLQREVEQGKPLRPRLSTGLLFRSADPLFNDWGVMHFHLGTRLQPDGFVKRTNHTAYAVVERDRFLLLAVLPHQPRPYEDTELLRRWQANWPDSIARFQVDAKVDDGTREISKDPALILAYRDKGYNVPTVVGGRTYLPMGGGVTVDGGAVDALKEENRLTYEARWLQRDWQAQFPGQSGRLRFGYQEFVVQDSAGNLWHQQAAGQAFSPVTGGLLRATHAIWIELKLS